MSTTNDSLEQLYIAFDKYADMMFRISIAQLKNWHDAEDVVHDVFIKLLESRPSFESEEHMKAWLIRVTINSSKDYLKSAWIRRVVHMNDEALGLGVIGEVSDLTRSILNLPPINRQIILLHYYIGYNISEVAALMGKKPAAIATRLHRIKKTLKLDMTEEIEIRNVKRIRNARDH